MDKENLTELTNKLYKMTLLFPKKEPLRYKMREVADEILANLITWGVSHGSNPGRGLIGERVKLNEVVFSIEKDIGVLRGYFEVAKWQNWVNYFDVLEIEEEYDKIKCDFKGEIEGLEEVKSLKTEDLPGLDTSAESKSLDSRQGKILEFLKEKGKVQVWEVKEVFPEVSKRTLRRDFEKLLKQGMIERMGERNSTFYQLNPVRDSEDGEKIQSKRISNGVKKQEI